MLCRLADDEQLVGFVSDKIPRKTEAEVVCRITVTPINLHNNAGEIIVLDGGPRYFPEPTPVNISA